MADDAALAGRIGALIDTAVAGGGIPGAVAEAGQGTGTVARWTAGLADATRNAERPVRDDTLFDLASLTKVVATATTTLALAGQDKLALGDQVTSYLPGYSALPGVTIRHLLTHSSGLPASRKFYLWCDSRDELLTALRATRPQAPPGASAVYSDLGFIILGELVAEVTGEPLDAAFARLVAGPLGMTRTAFRPAAERSAFAATEPGPDGVPWTGVVHDENARVLGGVAGHAGLFSDRDDLARYLSWWVSDADGPVPAALRAEAAACQTAGLGALRGIGWMCARDETSFLLAGWSASAACHTGFTGTSLAIDPGSGTWSVLLTNSVHFGRDATAIKALRRRLHGEVAAALIIPQDRVLP